MEPMENKWSVQFRKGTLEMLILAVVLEEPKYGLQILHKLHAYESLNISEGTLYPLLERLKRDGVITSNWVQEGDARPRKYYTITPQGERKLNGLITMWQQSATDVNDLLVKFSVKRKA